MAPSSSPAPARPERDPDGDSERARRNWLERRRARVADEIARNRRGEYQVPTWVLALALALIVGAWVALIVFS